MPVALQVTGKAKEASNQAAVTGKYAKDKASKVTSDTADTAQATKDKAGKVASDTASTAQATKDKATKMASDAYDAVRDCSLSCAHILIKHMLCLAVSRHAWLVNCCKLTHSLNEGCHPAQAGAAKDKVVNTGADAVGSASKTGKQAYNSASKTGKQAYDATKDAAEDLAATVKSYLTWAQNKASELTKTSKDTTNVRPLAVPCIPGIFSLHACEDACRSLFNLSLAMKQAARLAAQHHVSRSTGR